MGAWAFGKRKRVDFQGAQADGLAGLACVGHPAGMNLYFPALVLLGIAAFIENRCSTPGLRPEDPKADRAFRLLGRSAFAVWLGLLAWGFVRGPWWVPVSAAVGSLAANALVLRTGVKPWWPGLSMGLALAGLAAASWVLSRQ